MINIFKHLIILSILNYVQANFYREIEYHDWVWLHENELPVLIIHGINDDCASNRMIEEIRHRIMRNSYNPETGDYV